MITLDIKYSRELEVERVVLTLQKLSWFTEHGYKPLLPEGIDVTCTREQVSLVLSETYSPHSYEEFAESLNERWAANLKAIQNLQDSPLNIKSTYHVVLTKYGVGGSYNSSTDTVIINIQSRSVDAIVGTLLHEIVHISIQSLIEKYKVTHWRKERLVDLLGERFFPGLHKMQNIKDVSVVDEKYEELYPDIEAIIQSIGEQKLEG